MYASFLSYTLPILPLILFILCFSLWLYISSLCVHSLLLTMFSVSVLFLCSHFTSPCVHFFTLFSHLTYHVNVLLTVFTTCFSLSSYPTSHCVHSLLLTCTCTLYGRLSPRLVLLPGFCYHFFKKQRHNHHIKKYLIYVSLYKTQQTTDIIM